MQSRCVLEAGGWYGGMCLRNWTSSQLNRTEPDFLTQPLFVEPIQPGQANHPLGLIGGPLLQGLNMALLAAKH